MGIPLYEHDCDECKFLGCDKANGEAVDVYLCEKSFTGPTLVVRSSSNGPDYVSFPKFLIKHLYSNPQAEAQIALKHYKQLGIAQ